MSDLTSALSAVRTIPQLAHFAAERFGTRRAIVDEDGATLSYLELQAQARDTARALLAAGVERGDRVAIWAPNCARWVVAALGLQMAGASLVPLNTRLKGKEAAYILRRSRAKLLFTVDEFLGIRYRDLLIEQDLPELQRIVLIDPAASGPSWDDFLASGRTVSERVLADREAAVAPDDISDILFTSGTTGVPKGAMTAHAQNLRLYREWGKHVELTEADRYLIANPFFHSFGYKAGWLAALMRGATIFPHAVFDSGKILRCIERERISVLPGPPTLYVSLLNAPNLSSIDKSSLRVAITGAAVVPAQLVRQMRSELGFKMVLTAYGLTETCGTVTMCSPDDQPETVAETCGRALDGIEIRIQDDDGAALPPGAPGEVAVRGYNVMKGYFEDAEETAKALDAQGWFRTGDIGTLNERGYLRITDRSKDVFIVGGFNCYPTEIENLLLDHPAIRQAAVIGVPDERLGEVGKAFVILKAGMSETPASLLCWSREHMANYKVPRSIEICDQLPMTASGKVQKFLLRARA